MKNKFLSVVLTYVLSITVLTIPSPAQNKNSSDAYMDICHVYVVDTAKAKKLQDLYFESKESEMDEKMLTLKKEAETEFPIFKTRYAEEELTTKHYPFPNSSLIITASIYYTDESLASRAPDGYYSGSSMIIGISVTNKKEISSIGFPPINNAITEVTYDNHTNMIRTKKYVTVRGRIYLVGLECDCAAKRQNKKGENK